MPKLAPLGRAIAVDLRGHGDSDWDVYSRYNTTAHLEDMNFIIGTLDLNKIILIGHSLGGEIAMRLAAQHPERIAGLVIVDSGPDSNRAAIAHIRQEFISESRVYSEYLEYIAHLEVKLPLTSLELRWKLAQCALRLREQGGYMLKRDPAMAESEPTATNTLSDLWSMLKEIYCPVLIVRGMASSVYPLSVAKRMASIFPHAHLASIKLAGHAVMIDNPEDFAATVLCFIRKEFIARSIESI